MLTLHFFPSQRKQCLRITETLELSVLEACSEFQMLMPPVPGRLPWCLQPQDVHLTVSVPETRQQPIRRCCQGFPLQMDCFSIWCHNVPLINCWAHCWASLLEKSTVMTTAFHNLLCRWVTGRQRVVILLQGNASFALVILVTVAGGLDHCDNMAGDSGGEGTGEGGMRNPWAYVIVSWEKNHQWGDFSVIELAKWFIPYDSWISGDLETFSWNGWIFCENFNISCFYLNEYLWKAKSSISWFFV